MESFAWTLVSTTLALALVLALAWLVMRALARLQRGRQAGTSGDALRFVRAVPLGPRERMVVVHYRGEEWVLGVCAGSVTLLSRGSAPPTLHDIGIPMHEALR